MAEINPEWEQYGPAYVAYMTKVTAEREAREQRQTQQYADRGVVFAYTRLPSIRFLRDLYDVVIAHSEKRMPKWKFRLADDLAMEIQPKLTRSGRLFHWRAIQCEDVDLKILNTPSKGLPASNAHMNGTLTNSAGSEDYVLQCKRVGPIVYANHTDGTYGYAGESYRRLAAMRIRVNEAFTAGRFDAFSPGMLLSDHCLICGKGLTDPASMARFIGPECFNSSSINVPWLRDLPAKAA